MKADKSNPVWQGPEVSLQDALLMDFACPDADVTRLGGPLLCPKAGMSGASTIEQTWADTPDMMPLVKSVGRENGQAEWWKSKRGNGKSALKTVLSELGPMLPDATVVGRVGLIGFSQGCSGVRECLTDVIDAERLDFVYACDGMAGEIDSNGQVTRASLSPWTKFAVRAASGQGMMVVTTTEIVNKYRKTKGAANTEESSLALLKYVREDLKFREVAPRMIPRGLIGEVGFAPTPPQGRTAWPSWSNSLAKSVTISAPWAVKKSTLLGNLIVVNFKTVSPEESAAGYKASNSEASHVFQSWWVCDQVLKEVLACRWAAKCQADRVNPGTLSGTMGLSAYDESPRMVIHRRFPSVLLSTDSLDAATAAMAGYSGLGATDATCVLEGIFSNLVSLEDLQSARVTNAVKSAAVGVGAAAAGYWFLKRILGGSV
jgi:hypothetical protein